MVGLGFLQSVFYIKSIPTHEKLFACGKRSPKCHFKPTFFLGWGVRRFRNNIYRFSNPTEFGESQTYCCTVLATRFVPCRNHPRYRTASVHRAMPPYRDVEQQVKPIRKSVIAITSCNDGSSNGNREMTARPHESEDPKSDEDGKG